MVEEPRPDFAAFFCAVHGYEPFPWQRRLADVVLARRWPDVLNLPTGVGKTAVLDVALFTLAYVPERAPRRIVFVVDRRVVVDQAAQRAELLLARLREPTADAAANVAARLRRLSRARECDPPFAISVLRGGMPRDDAWARRPDQPVIAVSTVDQIGSRLLFRGYGVSQSMAPIHAGLLGNDTLFLLDEVHLSVPFCETLLSVANYRSLERKKGELAGVPNRWATVRLSATPSAVRAEDELFELAPEDFQNERLARRLRASKVARLIRIAVTGKDEAGHRQKVAREAVKHAVTLVDRGARVVAVVVNRVDTARLVRRELTEHAGRVDALLLTGRMRPLDRDRVLGSSLAARIVAGRRRDSEDRSLIVVATQCIEAGADFDFDGLVTECASLDALRQRFGRLDRLGDLGRSDAVILCRSDLANGKTTDPVYGEALANTWNWLVAQGDSVDLGVQHLSLPAPHELCSLVTPEKHAPILLPSHLERWAQTSPIPEPDPDIALWLHGLEPGQAEVQIVWRADVTHEQLDRARGNDGKDELQTLVALLSACRPSALEAVAVPLSAAKAWLRGSVAEMADVEGGPSTEAEDDAPRLERLALRWLGENSTVVGEQAEADTNALRPGDTLIVPASYGGLSYDNWDPTSFGESVNDLGDLAAWKQRGRATLRLHREVLRTLENAAASTGSEAEVDQVRRLCVAPPDAAEFDEGDRDLGGEVADWLRQLLSVVPEPWKSIVAELSRGRRGGGALTARLLTMPTGHLVLIGRHRAARDTGDTTTEGDTGSFSGREVPLERHSYDVREWAKEFAQSLQLPEHLYQDVVLSAWLHDIGKADSRFQRMLLGGSEVRLGNGTSPLAKSAAIPEDAASRRLARVLAGYPSGYRHELLSVAMLQSRPEALDGVADPDLVLHLVGSHHGWCRPFAPHVEDTHPVDVTYRLGHLAFEVHSAHHLARIDSGVADRFFRLTRKYGLWGLAWLEAIVRLADHRASEAELEARDD